MEVSMKVATILLDKADPPLASSTFRRGVAEGTDVAGLVRELGLPDRLVGTVTVNNRRSPKDRLLADGDTVAIIPAISGG